jgi:hypothetical protein
MLDGWRAQMLARGLTTQTIKQRCQLLDRFQDFTGEFPWQWRPMDIEEFLAGLRSGEKLLGHSRRPNTPSGQLGNPATPVPRIPAHAS